jgi:F-type H+-transporting ATPase subunit delta
MAELTTIARPYAEAVFRIAREQQAFPAWSKMLALTSAVTADPKVAAALDEPERTAADKEALLLSLCGDELDELGRNFLRTLVEADRVTVLPEIAALYEGLKDAAEGVAKARIDTAFPLTPTELTDLTAALEKKFGKKIEPTVNVDPSLIGGARITVGDTVIDGSVQAKLAAMASQLHA